MNDTVRWTSGQPRRQESRGDGDGSSLADILERVLDKGIVIAGDVQVNLLDIELLTIKIRLVVASVDRAKEMGIDWWERDPSLSAGRQDLEQENARLRERVEALERRGRPPTREDPGELEAPADGGGPEHPAEEHPDDLAAEEPEDLADEEDEHEEDEAQEDEAGEDEPEPEPVEAAAPARRKRERPADRQPARRRYPRDGTRRDRGR